MNLNDTNDKNTNDKNNICFFLHEPPVEELDDNNVFLDQLMQEFDEDDTLDNTINQEEQNNEYYVKKNIYENNEELYYDKEYKVKDLMKICQYYEISKNIKAAKCKKEDIISTIIYFESCAENYDIVQRRHKLWSYMTELANDPKMRAYVYWS